MEGQRFSHYQVEKLLGIGGMGIVYRATDVRLGRSVALKVLRDEVLEDSSRRRRFLQEARSASAVTHPAIAQIYDVGQVDDVLFIAMEYVDGKTVRNLIAAKEVDLLAAIDIAIQVANGLGSAHSAGIIHRDIKSDNIMVTRDGHVKILDFGLAKIPDLSNGKEGGSREETFLRTEAGTVLGTVAYMSPEQARGKELDFRSDLFSLGIVLYEMVTGELPFKGQSPLDTMHAIAFEEMRPATVIRRDIPPELHRVLSRCLRKQPQDRYVDAEALVTDLRRLKDQLESGSQRAVSFAERVEGWKDWVRFSIPFGFTGGMATLAVVALVVILIVTQVQTGTVVLLLLLGIPLYRYIRNRRQRLLSKFVAKARKIEGVQVISVRDHSVTVILETARAHQYIRLNDLIQSVNKKLLYGSPFEISVRAGLSRVELNAVLQSPGTRFVRDDVLN